MYCTLQEAYSIPSFDPASKSGRKAAKACNRAVASAPADPYDAYGAESGRELAAAPRSFGREDFMNPGEKASYAAMANDYKYYCENYGVCKEGFENPSPAQQKAKKSPKPQRTCGPLQPPVYEYPLQEEDRQRFKKALDSALAEEQAATAPPRAEPRRADMDNVSGYYDEDLELYLQTKDMKSANVPMSADLPKEDLKAQPYDPNSSPFAAAMHRYKGQPMGAPLREGMASWAAPARDKAGMWMDLVMFILLGVLIIVLCDQLVRLGMMLGMKSTVEALQPLLAQIQRNA